MKALGEALARLKILDETPDIGLTDEELELFMGKKANSKAQSMTSFTWDDSSTVMRNS